MSSLAGRSHPRLVAPGQLLNTYPEVRQETQDAAARLFLKGKRTLAGPRISWRAFQPTLKRVQARCADIEAHGDLTSQIAPVRDQLLASGLATDAVVDALALMGAAVANEFGFKPHPEQYFCSWALLHGRLAEMATGEGKSITAGITAGVAALAGAPVHVITTNDYLVQRDAEGVMGLLAHVGVSCDFVTPDQDDDQRRAGYGKDVCYVSNKQLVFDYLRDRQVMGNRPATLHARLRALHSTAQGQPLLRGLCFAVVDEADSVLIDDAITPLILSQLKPGSDEDVGRLLSGLSLAQRLEPAIDFNVDSRLRRVSITEHGEDRLAELARNLDGTFKNRRYRLEVVRQALSAIHLFERDVDYLVRDGQVMLIDQSTGRLMPDRKLQHGLHQMVELKERCELSGESDVLASLSFQHFFKRYAHLCGMTGTAKEAAAELEDVYGLRVTPVPTHKPNQRVERPATFCESDEVQIQALVTRVNAVVAAGQSVLIGTRTLAKSEQIAAGLQAAGIQCRLLNARQDAEEAAIVAAAGETGAVTIATNMAGRGTDIPLTPEVEASGGLHVIVAELNENARVDRQLIGRSARQGDPGSFEYIVSAEDPVLRDHASPWLRSLASVTGSSLGDRVSLYHCKWAQKRLERSARSARRQVARHDEQMQKRLAFAGYKE